MATSGTKTWNPDLGEIVEEAYERAGLELRGGYDLKTAYRSLNFLLAEWANKGLNLFTVQSGTITLVPGQKTYDSTDGLPASAVDYIEHVLRTTQSGGNGPTDITLNRITVSTYAAIPNKDIQARPIQIYVDRAITGPTITLWPTPDSSQTYTLAYWYLDRIEDATSASANSVNTTLGIPYRFIEAITSGLAYKIALKRPEAADRLETLKMLYDEAFQLAADEDRDRSSVRFVPWNSFQTV